MGPRAAWIVLLAVSGVACNHAHSARTPAAMTALAMPAPPARLLIPVELPEPPPDPPVMADIPTPAPSPARPREAAARPAAQPPMPPTTAASAPETPSAPVLQTATSTEIGPLEQRIAALLASAELNLGRLAYRELGAGARTQYDQARSFMRMADAALKTKNYIYAERLATKAAQVAALLVRG